MHRILTVQEAVDTLAEAPYVRVEQAAVSLAGTPAFRVATRSRAAWLRPGEDRTGGRSRQGLQVRPLGSGRQGVAEPLTGQVCLGRPAGSTSGSGPPPAPPHHPVAGGQVEQSDAPTGPARQALPRLRGARTFGHRTNVRSAPLDARRPPAPRRAPAARRPPRSDSRRLAAPWNTQSRAAGSLWHSSEPPAQLRLAVCCCRHTRAPTPLLQPRRTLICHPNRSCSVSV